MPSYGHQDRPLHEHRRWYHVSHRARSVGPLEKRLQVICSRFGPSSGEVFVLDDGGEADLDLGNYERYLNVTLGRDNNITTGKIYREVIEKEVRFFGRACEGPRKARG